MPFTITWTHMQIIEMRVGAVEFLRMIQRRANLRRFSTDLWGYWVSVHGMPVPDNWDEVRDYEEFVMEYRERLFRGIQWHAFRGRYGPSNSMARMRRIRQITESIDRDLLNLQRAGVDLSSPASTNYTASLYIPTSSRPLCRRRTI